MNTKKIATLLAKFAPDTKLCQILVEEFETGGTIHNALREAGYDESGLIVINDLSMWNSTVEQLQAFLVKA
jgi:hypothetical protein